MRSETTEKLSHFAEAFRIWKLSRLSNLFDELRKNLIAVDESTQSGSEYEIASSISDAVFTCKAVKTCYKGRLEDPRVQASLIGKEDRQAVVETVENIPLIKVAEEISCTKKKYSIGNSYFMEVDGRGTVFRHESKIDPLEQPDKPHTKNNITNALIVGKRLIVSRLPSTKNSLSQERVLFLQQSRKLNPYAGQVTFKYDILTTIYKAFRSNLFAPEAFYTLVKYHKLYSLKEKLYLVDENNHICSAFVILL